MWDQLRVEIHRIKAAMQPTRTRKHTQRKALAFQQLERRVLLASLSATTWTSIGPAPIVSGQDPGGGPVTGRITGIAPDPADPNTLYVAAAGGGVWKTGDGGTTWIPLTDNIKDGKGNPVAEALGALAMAKSNLTATAPGYQILYAGIDSGDTQGVLVSLDGGTHWTLETDSGVFNGLGVSRLVVDRNDPTGQTVYAMMNNLNVNGSISGVPGIYESTDGGQSWTNTTAGISTDDTFTDFLVDPANSLVLYAAIGPPIFQTGASAIDKSVDGGLTWTELSGGAPEGDTAGSIALAEAPSGPEVLFAVSTDPTTGAIQIDQTTDAGATWNDVTNGAATGGAPYLVTIDPSNPNDVFIFGQGQYDIETTTGGTSWSDISVDPAGNGPHVDNHAVDFDAGGNLLLGNDGGLWKLTQPASLTDQRWIDLNGNLGITQFYDVVLDPTNPGIAYGGSQDNGTDQSQNSLGWVQLQEGDGGNVRVDGSNPQTIYQEFYDVSLQRSDDGGMTFTGISPPGAQGGKFIEPFVLDPSDPSELLFGTDTLYESTDQGNTWTTVGTPGTSFNASDATIDAIAVSGTGSNAILYVMAGDGIDTSQDNGTNWTHTAVPGYNGYHYSDPTLVIDPTNPQVAYAVRLMGNPPGTAPLETGHVFRTADGGATWADITGDLPNTAVNTIALNALGGKTQIWVGTDAGVYGSTDLGASWSLFGAGFPYASVTSLEYLPDSNILVAGTYGRGAWEILDPVVLGVPSAPQLAPGSDTGASGTDGLTRDNGSSSAPLTITVGGVSPSSGFVQLFDVTHTASPVALGAPVQSVGGTATITLSAGAGAADFALGLPLGDGVHQLAAAIAASPSSAPGTLSGSTAITIQSSVNLVGITPAAGSSVVALPGGQVTLNFDHRLAGLSNDGPALGPSDRNALTLTPGNGPALALTAVYYIDTADGTSSIVLTEQSPPTSAVETLQVDLSAFTDLAGNSLSAPGGGRYTFTVTGPPDAPITLNPIPAQTVAPGGVLAVPATATDPDLGRTLVYSLGSGAPAGAAINPGSGLFTWTPSPAQAGTTYTIAVTVAVQNLPGVSDTKLLTITVLAPPQVQNVATVQSRKGRVILGTSAITIVFNEPMAPSAGLANFYALSTPGKLRVGRKSTTTLVPTAFTAQLTTASTVTLRLAKPSRARLALTVTVRAGVPAANGLTLGQAFTQSVQ
jgi:hypothetical protein